MTFNPWREELSEQAKYTLTQEAAENRKFIA